MLLFPPAGSVGVEPRHEQGFRIESEMRAHLQVTGVVIRRRALAGPRQRHVEGPEMKARLPRKLDLLHGVIRPAIERPRGSLMRGEDLDLLRYIGAQLYLERIDLALLDTQSGLVEMHVPDLGPRVLHHELQTGPTRRSGPRVDGSGGLRAGRRASGRR